MYSLVTLGFIARLILFLFPASSPLLVLTVATKDTESLQRYLRSAKTYGLNAQVLGLGSQWNGGDVRTSPGGGQKVNLIKAELEKYKDDKEKIILFTDR